MSLHPDTSTTLATEVTRFAAWAKSLPDTQRSAEWEGQYPDWQRLYEAAIAQLAKPITEWTQADNTNVLYAISRDNEAEFLVEQASKQPSTFLRLAETAMTSAERDARWQFAAWLGNVETARRPQAEPLLLTLASDDDSYVRRRSLTALAAMKSARTEEIAERLWQAGNELERVSCLHALQVTTSLKLQDYLQRAHNSGQDLLMQAAREITAEIAGR